MQQRCFIHHGRDGRGGGRKRFQNLEKWFIIISLEIQLTFRIRWQHQNEILSLHSPAWLRAIQFLVLNFSPFRGTLAWYLHELFKLSNSLHALQAQGLVDYMPYPFNKFWPIPSRQCPLKSPFHHLSQPSFLNSTVCLFYFVIFWKSKVQNVSFVSKTSSAKDSARQGHVFNSWKVRGKGGSRHSIDRRVSHFIIMLLWQIWHLWLWFV